MAKTLIVSIGMIAIIVLLVIIVARQQTIVTTPVTEQIQVIPEALTPRAPEIERGEPTPRAKEPEALPSGVPAEQVYPQDLSFWVNSIRVPETTAYESGYNFIPIKKSNLKTFSGSFGPYFDPPPASLKVILCSELYKVQAAPTCEQVPLIYRDNYVSFARGYQFDEYIGGQAAKDYLAYYDIYLGDTAIAHSNVAVIRTVAD